MYKFFKKPEVPTSSPDKITFPFEFSGFKYTMENYVKSFTRNRVTKENLIEILDEVNAALRTDSENFKTWDYLAVATILAINSGILACILTLQVKAFAMFAIKLGFIVLGIIINFVIWGCCLDGRIDQMRNKIQYILDSKDEYFESKGMRWSVCVETEFPYWVELHVQSQFEMRLAQEKDEFEGKKKKKEGKDSENKGILESRVTTENKPKKPKLAGLFGGRTQKGLVNFDVDEELAEHEESQVQPPNKHQVEIDMIQDKKFDRLYAPLEEDYEENYDDDEEANA